MARGQVPPRLLIDTSVVLDLLLDRQPHAAAAAHLFMKAEGGEIAGFVGATTITTAHYLASKAVGVSRANRLVRTLLALVDVAPVNRRVIAAALDSGMTDFEDAVLAEAARRIEALGIVTRDTRGFAKAGLPAYTPLDAIRMLAAGRG